MRIRKTAVIAVLALGCITIRAEENVIPNRLIDYDRFLESAQEVGKVRKQRRVTEEQFIKMSQEPGTIVFDARSDEKYRLLHIKGATHLSLPDVTAAELAKVISEKTARILIYCNNNFDNEPAAFPAKATDASLNIFTFNTLYSYGYKNIYELGPVIDANHTKLQFEGTRASTPRR
jgi:hypothetical protein